MSERESTAYHEAGHAVIGRILKLPGGPASIEPDHDSAGQSDVPEFYKIKAAWFEEPEPRPRIDTDYIDDVISRARIITFMAGAEAENEFDFVPTGDEHDRSEILGMTLRLSSPPSSKVELERCDQRLRAKTRGLVRRHRDSIETVAKALLDHGTLQDDEINELISRL